MSKKLQSHIKAFLWNGAGIAIVAVSAYILNLGDIRQIDPVQALNVAVIAVAGLIVNRATKEANK